MRRRLRKIAFYASLGVAIACVVLCILSFARPMAIDGDLHGEWRLFLASEHGVIVGSLAQRCSPRPGQSLSRE